MAAITPPAVPAAPVASGAWLSDGDVERYADIFSLQEAGLWQDADVLIRDVEDRRLIGHVLFQRYMHPTDWTASYGQLRDWLASYGDHPGADRVYELALSRRPSGAARPTVPADAEAVYGRVERFGVPRCAAADIGDRGRQLLRRIMRHRMEDRPDRALDYLEASGGGVTQTTYDRLLSQVAAGFFYDGQVTDALDHARAAAERSGGRAPIGYWITGMASWWLGDYGEAAAAFEGFADAECASAWGRAAGAYWAARSHLRNGNYAVVSGWLERAAQYPRTFYGLVAGRALGINAPLSFNQPALGESHFDRLARHPAGRRALGLIQVGQTDLAEPELMRLVAQAADPQLRHALIGVAEDAGMPRLAMAIGTSHRPSADGYYDGALYPLTRWRPPGGLRVDQALVYAIMREESRFDPDAVSWAGATGLMQLMPSTASYVAGTNYRGSRSDALTDPSLNMDLGQRYLQELLGDRAVGRDLIRVLVSYNAGPGNLLDWLEEIEHGEDPLLLIETLPSTETRAYAERVMASYWIYRMRLGQATPSLDDIAAGDWPLYVRQDQAPTQVVDRGSN